MSDTITLHELTELRRTKYRQTQDTRCRSENDGLDFINELGFCLLIGSVDADLPNLMQSAVEPHQDPWSETPAHMWWDLKQTLPARKACYYAKVLRGRGTFISWDCLPYFYALHASKNDYVDDYRAGTLSRDEKRILDLIAEYPDISSRELRRKFGPVGKDTSKAMDRAMLPLQEAFRITVSGGSIEGWSLHNWSLVEDWVPREFLRTAQAIAPQDAMKELIVRYVRMSIAASAGDIAWIFRRKRKEIAVLVQELVADGRLHEIEVEGLGVMMEA
jgi:hypothetical protein